MLMLQQKLIICSKANQGSSNDPGLTSTIRISLFPDTGNATRSQAWVGTNPRIPLCLVPIVLSGMGDPGRIAQEGHWGTQTPPPR
ncbi:unnamed protein product [Ixodes pacificus]